MARSLPDLGEHDVRRVSGLLRVLGSVQTWLRMREEYGLDGIESGPLVIWAIEVLEREIRAVDTGPAELITADLIGRE